MTDSDLIDALRKELLILDDDRAPVAKIIERKNAAKANLISKLSYCQTVLLNVEEVIVKQIVVFAELQLQVPILDFNL
jgi:hypothetical protein